MVTAPAITVRPATAADAAGIARVHVDTWRTTYPGHLPDDFIAGLSCEQSERQWASAAELAEAGTRCLYVAVDGESAVLGFACGGPEGTNDLEFTGELYAIYVLASHQGRGIGRRLVQAVAQWMLGAGHASMLVWVLATNQVGRRAYEALGAHPVRDRRVPFRGLTIDEAGYGWKDVRTLLPVGAE